MIDEEVVRVVRKAQSTADQILKDNVEQLHNLAKALLEHETIDGDEVVAVMDGKKISRSSNGQAKKSNSKSQKTTSKNTISTIPNNS